MDEDSVEYPIDDDADDYEISTLAMQVDRHRGVVTIPMYEHGRQVRPCLFEGAIVDIVDEVGNIVIDDINPDEAVYATCRVYGDQPRSFVLIELDYTGETLH